MQRPVPGRYVTVPSPGEAFRAFVPAPLPPAPEVEWTAELRARFDAALVAIGRLDAVSDLLPNASLLLYSFVRKEAVLSSMIARIGRICHYLHIPLELQRARTKKKRTGDLLISCPPSSVIRSA